MGGGGSVLGVCSAGKRVGGGARRPWWATAAPRVFQLGGARNEWPGGPGRWRACLRGWWRSGRLIGGARRGMAPPAAMAGTVICTGARRGAAPTLVSFSAARAQGVCGGKGMRRRAPMLATRVGQRAPRPAARVRRRRRWRLKTATAHRLKC